MSSRAARGVIEGFYGPPWSPAERLDVVSFCAERGMNAYVYAPKDDPKHRVQWREPYSSEEIEHFRALARHCRSLGVVFGFAVSPGVDVDYRSPADRALVLEKLSRARDAGAGWLVMAFDDLPGQKTRGSAQAELVGWLHEELAVGAEDLRLSVVPTEYAGVTASPYLAELAEGLPVDVDVAWTGRWIVSPTITVADAKARAAALGGRPPLLWDNYPVNDYCVASLFLGPYTGRDPGLPAACSGVLCNPMPLAHASKVALATAAEFFHRGSRYRPEDAWRRAIEKVGGPQAAVLETLSAACADGALAAPPRLALHRLLDRYEARDASLADLGDHLLAAREAAALVAGDPSPLWAEVRPWLEQMTRDARAGLAAVRLLRTLERGTDREVADAANGLQAAWQRARPGSGLNVFGPRFATYPMTTFDTDGVEVLDLEEGVREDASAVDRLCRMAKEAYVQWCERPEQVVGL